MAERIGARNGTGGAVLREMMRLGTHFWARRVWVDFRETTLINTYLCAWGRKGEKMRLLRNCWYPIAAHVLRSYVPTYGGAQ